MPTFEQGFADAEKAADSVLKSLSDVSSLTRQLRKAAQEGNIAALRRASGRLQDGHNLLRQEVANATEAWPFTPEEEQQYLQEQYAEELKEEAQKKHLQMYARDGRLIAHPFRRSGHACRTGGANKSAANVHDPSNKDRRSFGGSPEASSPVQPTDLSRFATQSLRRPYENQPAGWAETWRSRSGRPSRSNLQSFHRTTRGQPRIHPTGLRTGPLQLGGKQSQGGPVGGKSLLSRRYRHKTCYRNNLVRWTEW